jgi:hypothetical protein
MQRRAAAVRVEELHVQLFFPEEALALSELDEAAVQNPRRDMAIFRLCASASEAVRVRPRDRATATSLSMMSSHFLSLANCTLALNADLE